MSRKEKAIANMIVDCTVILTVVGIILAVFVSKIIR
jgi:hypothetical protein